MKQIQTPGKGIHKKRVACSLQKTIAVSTTRSSSVEGELLTRNLTAPNAGNYHPKNEIIPLLTGLQHLPLSRSLRVPLAPHSVLCVPHFAPHHCPSWGQILSSPSCALSPAYTAVSCAPCTFPCSLDTLTPRPGHSHLPHSHPTHLP